MNTYKLYQVDAFTKERFTGNPAGVITNADGMSDEMMQKIARELNNPNTAFIFNSKEQTHDVHIRFYTPTQEESVCGHATIASHYARAVENNLDTVRVYQKTGVRESVN
jgi:PhzF family phenazine biosynthesis protein